MTRDWKISLSVAILSHVGLLYAFKQVMPRPARLTRETVMEITMVAAPAAPTPAEAPADVATPAAPAVEIPPTPAPIIEMEKSIAPAPVSTPPDPLPRDRPKPANHPRPTPPSPRPVEQPMKVAVNPPALAPAIVSDGSSAKIGVDTITQRAEAGIPAKPNYRKNPEPPYPPAARRRRQEGSVLLAVKVSAEGHTIRVELKQSSGYPALDAAAIEAVREWEFEPARLGTTPHASDIEVPVRFQLSK